MQLTLLVDDRVKIETQAVSQVILQGPFRDIGIPELGVEAQDQHKPVFEILRHDVLLDIRETVTSLQEFGAIHFAFFVGEAPVMIFVITLVGDVEFHLNALLIEDGGAPHSPSELDLIVRIKDPPEGGSLVPTVGLVEGLLVFDCNVGFLSHFIPLSECE